MYLYYNVKKDKIQQKTLEINKKVKKGWDIKIKDNKYQIIIFTILIFIVSILLIINIKQNDNDLINDFEEYENLENEESIESVETNKIYVYVAGEVVSPGVVELDEGDRVEDAIKSAGGITENANIKNINLAKIVEDGEKIYIPNKDEEIENYEEKSSAKININRATETELQSLNGIGPAMAAKIVEYRQNNGFFKSIEDIKNVSGIGESKFIEIKDYITI